MERAKRRELVKLQLERADRFFAQAEQMMTMGCLDLAANRYYYACYHAIQGLFINDELSSHTHKGMHQVLGLNYVLKGKFDAKLSGFLRTMEQLREKADYNCTYDVTMEEVQEMQEPSRQIIQLVKHLVHQ